MYVKLFYIIFIININVIFLLLYNNIALSNVDINFVYGNSGYTIGYYPNNVTGLFTKLIGIGSIVGFCIIKQKIFKSNI